MQMPINAWFSVFKQISNFSHKLWLFIAQNFLLQYFHEGFQFYKDFFREEKQSGINLSNHLLVVTFPSYLTWNFSISLTSCESNHSFSSIIYFENKKKKQKLIFVPSYRQKFSSQEKKIIVYIVETYQEWFVHLSIRNGNLE